MKKIIQLVLVLTFVMFSAPTLVSCQKEVDGDTMYEIIAEYVPENKTLTGVAKVTFQNDTEEELSKLKFQLYPNAYRKNALYKPVSTAYQSSAYYAGESYGEMQITSVNGSKNWEITGEDENILSVLLERSLFPSEKVVLDISFITKLAKVNHHTGITPKTVNLGHFYPVLCGIKKGGFLQTVYYSTGDPFYLEKADYKMTLTLPKEYLVATTGLITAERTLESKKVCNITALNVRDFAMTLSPNYKTLEKTVNDTQIKYYYYQDESPKESFNEIVECFTFYETNFGGYPYDCYSVAETGCCVDGVEYPTLSMISDSLKGKERARAIAHETAHQWWYAVVGSDQIENAWQDEGLAEYSAFLFFENFEKYGFTREELIKEALQEYRSYYDVYGSVLGRTDTCMTRHLKEYINDYEYKCIAYDKSVVMFDTLRKSVGDKKFLQGLKRYYKENKYKIASEGSLIGAFERTGSDVKGFFQSFLDGKAIL